MAVANSHIPSPFSRILITGGAGFVGSSLAVHLARARDATVVALDNLHRRGSDFTLERLGKASVQFVHGDVRIREDLEAAGPFDLMIECSAEPSVHAGQSDGPSYLLGSNLVGTINCLEAVRQNRAALIFLSTSRVYPIESLRQLPLQVGESRLYLDAQSEGTGWSRRGISTAFPLRGRRSLYGATKLASELLIEEYRHLYDLPAIVNRCGVIAGPWQMGKVDQGFVSLWAARHIWGQTLSYVGFGGGGMQVRDVLHVDDLCALIDLQIERLRDWSGAVLNVGGGVDSSVSLRELTELCVRRSGRRLDMRGVAESAAVDIPYYVTDNSEVTTLCGWAPTRSLDTVLDDIFAWLGAEHTRLRPLLG